MRRSTRFTCFCTAQTLIFQKKIVKLFRIFPQNFAKNPETTFLERPRCRGAVMSFKKKTFATFEFSLKTTKTASAKHHPGNEAWREGRKKVSSAPCAACASENCTESKNESLRCGTQCPMCASVNCADSPPQTQQLKEMLPNLADKIRAREP